jgi:hypothetical protein
VAIQGSRTEDADIDLDAPAPLVWFASFQDVLGTDEHGDPKLKNEGLYLIDWDCVVVDEYHFGAWRDAARSLYLGTGGGDSSEKLAVETPDLQADFQQSLKEVLPLEVAHYLFLSGTPFRALTEGEFLEDQVFNWTYSDEQRAKEQWAGPAENPYASLPQMHLLVYAMPDKLREVALNNQSEFSLTEFFRTERDEHDIPRFLHAKEVQKWLDLLRGQDLEDLWAAMSSQHRPPLPYEDLNLLRSLQHTVWYLPGVDACLAMRDLLSAQHNTFFRDYEIVVAAGQGAGLGEKALPPVERAIGRVPQQTKTITLSCGKLMTGVTVPAWAGSADAAVERDDEAAIAEFMEFLPVLSFDGYSMSRLEAGDVVDFLTRGISSSMLARRWNSPELLTLDLNEKLLASLEQVDLFRDISQDLTALINSHKELSRKKLAKEPLTAAEKEKDKVATKRRDDLKKKLQRFLTRIPAFMYLTDAREKSVKDVITKVEPELFKQVTQLTVDDFAQLLAAGVFADAKMNDAVWKFRTFEEPSLSYDEAPADEDVVGGWSVGRNERFARLVQADVLEVGQRLWPAEPSSGASVAKVTANFGLLVDGIRYASPREAALALSSDVDDDGWSFWAVEQDGARRTLEELEEHAGLAAAAR